MAMTDTLWGIGLLVSLFMVSPVHAQTQASMNAQARRSLKKRIRNLIKLMKRF